MRASLTALAACLSLSSCQGQVRDHATQEVVFEELVGLYKDFGRQEGSQVEVNGIVADRHLCELMCSWMNDGGAELTKAKSNYLNGSVLILTPDCDDTCGGNFGTWAEFKYLQPWCSLGLEAIIQVNDLDVPSIEANAHDGTKFEAFGDLKYSCNWYSTRLCDASEVFIDVHGGNLSGTLIDYNLTANRALIVFNNPAVQVIWRGIVPGTYFLVSLLSLYYLYLRFRITKLARVSLATRLSRVLYNTHGFILVVNAVVFLILAFVEVQGSHYSDDNLPLGVVYAFYTEFFGISVCLNWCLAILFSKLRAKFALKERKKKQIAKVRIYYVIATLLFCMDISLSLLVTSLTADVYELVVALLPLTFLVTQVIAVLFLAWEIHHIVITIHSVASSNDKRNPVGPGQTEQGQSAAESLECESAQACNSKASPILHAYERRFIFWLKVALVAASFNSLALLLIFARVDIREPESYVSVFTLVFISRAVTGFAQVQICKPVVKSVQTGQGRTEDSEIGGFTMNSLVAVGYSSEAGIQTAEYSTSLPGSKDPAFWRR